MSVYKFDKRDLSEVMNVIAYIDEELEQIPKFDADEEPDQKPLADAYHRIKDALHDMLQFVNSQRAALEVQ